MFHLRVILLILSSTFAIFAPSASNELTGTNNNWTPSEDSWNYWWSYSGVSGPTYWGLLNLDWFMCDKGRRQSPIDIETRSLVYDPHLEPLRVDNNLISGFVYNDGHAIVFNGSESSNQLIANSKLADNETNKQQNGSSNGGTSVPLALISKRHVQNEDEIFNRMHSALTSSESKSFSATDSDPSATILRDLSNSVELSISQNDRLQSIADRTSSLDATESALDPLSGSMESGNAANGAEQVESSSSPKIHFSGAGLAYTYKFEVLYLRFGSDSKTTGSEHQINGRAYAAELQLLAYNSILYKSFAEASSRPQGLLAVAILLDLLPAPTKTQAQADPSSTNGTKSSSNANSTVVMDEQLDSLLANLSEVKRRGASKVIHHFNLSALLPETNYFVAYEGSLTTPGCHESVNWLVLNKPLYIRQSNLDTLRSISADDEQQSGTFIAGNIRPVQPANNRPIRTNIRPKSNNVNENPEICRRHWTRYDYRQHAR